MNDSSTSGSLHKYSFLNKKAFSTLLLIKNMYWSCPDHHFQHNLHHGQLCGQLDQAQCRRSWFDQGFYANCYLWRHHSIEQMEEKDRESGNNQFVSVEYDGFVWNPDIFCKPHCSGSNSSHAHWWPHCALLYFSSVFCHIWVPDSEETSQDLFSDPMCIDKWVKNYLCI